MHRGRGGVPGRFSVSATRWTFGGTMIEIGSVTFAPRPSAKGGMPSLCRRRWFRGRPHWTVGDCLAWPLLVGSRRGT